MTSPGDWQRVDDKDVTWDWEDYTCGFRCKGCGQDIIFSEPGVPHICECGREYMLMARLEWRQRAPWGGL